MLIIVTLLKLNLHTYTTGRAIEFRKYFVQFKNVSTCSTHLELICTLRHNALIKRYLCMYNEIII